MQNTYQNLLKVFYFGSLAAFASIVLKVCVQSNDKILVAKL